MTSGFDDALQRATVHATRWIDSVADRPVPPSAGIDAMLARFGGPLPEHGLAPADVVDDLADGAEPGLMAIGSGRFFGWVMGATLPAPLAADWLVSAWDQNAGMRPATPAVVALEETAGGWILDLLGLPASADVGFTTGATMANFAGLAAARHAVLGAVGWDVETRGLSGAPAVRVLVGAERHDTVDLALRYLGLGAPTVVPADAQGRIDHGALAAALDGADAGPTIVALQAGNLHSGAFDPFDAAIATAHAHGAWVHVDGAFGLWAAASPAHAHLVAGVAAADSWATDAHKTLNVPYDCGIVVARDTSALRAALGVHTAYLATDAEANPYEKVAELSRRARGVPVWAALRSLGRTGVADLVGGLAARAAEFAAAFATVPGVEVCNDVVWTQVCLGFADDATTAAVAAFLAADGTAWLSASRWRGRAVVRISVSGFRTDADDVARTVDAVRRALASVG